VPAGGYGIFKLGAGCNATPVLIGTIPAGSIPARAHFLAVGSQYVPANYGGTIPVTGNLTLTSDIESDRNVAIFSTNALTSISSANRLDAVGFGLNAGGAICDLLKESNNLPALSGSTLNYSFYRTMTTTSGGNPKDTNDNAADFQFVDTVGSIIAGVPQKLGAPGPENLASPRRRDNTSPGIGLLLLDGTQSSAAPVNRFRDGTSGNANYATFGTLTIRRRVVNNTASPVTRLRVRIVEMTTLPVPSGTADVRALSGTVESVGSITDAGTCGAAPMPCTVAVQPTTLETPPAQGMGGGLNSTLSLPAPLGAGASVNINFLLGVQTQGTFRFLIIVEALP
jgi:hypothetical protein